jgi:hypothetical protein
MRTNRLNVLAVAVVAALSLFATSCGGGVQGHIYKDNGGVVQIELKSSGKAYVSAGPMTQTCTYSESGKTVTLMCQGDKTIFTVEDDGALSGPRDGLMARLTKVK